MTLSDRLIRYCDQNNIRYAGKRIVVALHLDQRNQYTDGDTLWRSLRTSGVKISPATVYDALNWLESAGFAERKLVDGRRNMFRVKSFVPAK
ncbi:MAG: transcriptional repressor [Dyadobacter fermentans]